MLPPFVDVAWLADHRAEIRLTDVRLYLDQTDPRAAYDAGHLPGAVFVDGHHDLSAPASDALGRHPLPTPEAFAATLGRLGIDGTRPVVAYDDRSGVSAARLVWMLRATGYDAALLDGGLDAWTGPLETDPTVPDAVIATPVPWPADRLATLQDALGPAQVVLDARPAERYAGAPDDLDPRAGHIPGARSLPCRENLGSDGTLLPDDILRQRFARVGVTTDASVVSSCGSGVTACHNLLVMEHLGLAPGRLYPGSWSQYSRTDLPVATGPTP